MKKVNLKLLLILLVFQCHFNWAQNSSGRIEAIKLIQEGDLHLRYGDWEQALFSYTNAIQADVTFAEAYMRRGQLYEKTTHTQEALADYTMAIQLNPYIDMYYNQRARIRMLSFDYYGSLEDINAAIDINANNQDYLRRQTDNYISLGLYENAVKNLNDPSIFTEVEVLQREALMAITTNDLAAAETLLNQIFEKGDSSFLSFDLQGLLSMQREEYTEAIEWFEKAILSDSTQYLPYFNKSMAHRKLGQQQLALKDLDIAIKLNNNTQIMFFHRALIKKEHGDFDGAIQDYDFAIEIDSAYKQAIYNRAFTYKLAGDYYSAEEDLKFLVNSGDQKPEYWNMKGNILILKGDVFESVACFDNAISYDMNYAEAYFNRAIANLLLFRPLQACDDFQRSIELGYDKAGLMFDNFCGTY